MLDERTLLFMLSVVPALMALVSAGLRTGHPDAVRGLGSWALCLACFPIAAMVVAVWPASATDTRIVISNAGFAPAVSLYGYALLKFFGATLRPRRWIIGTLLVYLLSVMLSQTPAQAPWRVSLYSLQWLLMVVLAARAMLAGNDPRQGLGARVLALSLVMVTIAATGRLLLALTGLGAVTLLSGSMSNYMAMFLALVVLGLVLGTLGLILLANERIRQRLEDLACHDTLTGLLTRGGFGGLAEHALACARREGVAVGFLIIDIDHFKTVNDNHGHQAGDVVLAAVAQALREHAREVDLLSRFGGEEFAVLLPHADLAEVLKASERLRRCVAEAVIEHGDQRLRVTISVGATAAVAADTSIEQLYREADAALYRAKHNGRNRVESAPSALQLVAG